MVMVWCCGVVCDKVSRDNDTQGRCIGFRGVMWCCSVELSCVVIVAGGGIATVDVDYCMLMHYVFYLTIRKLTI